MGKPYRVGDIVGDWEILDYIQTIRTGTKINKMWRVRCTKCGKTDDRISRLLLRRCSHKGIDYHMHQQIRELIGSPCATCARVATCNTSSKCAKWDKWFSKAWTATIDALLTRAGKEPKYGEK